LPVDFGAKHGQAIVGWGDFRLHDPQRLPGAAWELGIGDTFSRRDIRGKLKVAVGGPLVAGHADLRDGRWHHVAAVSLSNGPAHAHGVTLLYVDGALQQRTFGSTRMRLDTDILSGKAEPVQFGRQVMKVTPRREFFKGAIDEVFLIDAALSGEAIRSIMLTNQLP
ncbi:MAG: LamG-like jellyroll fold domain-containing protein, partial [Verrucomicrobiota bacterium]